MILFESFTKRLQNRRTQLWKVRDPQRGLHFKVPKLPVHAHQNISKTIKLSNRCEETRCYPNILTRFRSDLLHIPSAYKSLYKMSNCFFVAWHASSHEDLHEVTSISLCAELNSQSVFPSTVTQRMELCLEFRSTRTVHSYQKNSSTKF